jgi:hypothetical protein
MAEFVARGEKFTDHLYPAWQEVERIVTSGGEAKIVITKRSNGSLPLLRHWRALMREMAAIYQRNGVTMTIDFPNGKQHKRKFTADDAHELFTYYLMPVDPETGLRKSWSCDGRKEMKPASTGERIQALEKLYFYAFERGWTLSRFDNSEYEQHQARQVA